MMARSFMFGAALAATAAFADTPVDFSGEWVADQTPADNGRAPVKPDTPRGGRSGVPGSHGGGRGMGGGAHHGGRNAPSSSAATPATLPGNDPRERAQILIIRQSETVFDVAADGQRTAYRFDNRSNYGQQYGGTVTLKWLAPEMSIETHVDDGATTVEHYTLSEDGKKLALEIRTERADGTAHEIRREFHRDDGSAAPAQTLP